MKRSRPLSLDTHLLLAVLSLAGLLQALAGCMTVGASGRPEFDPQLTGEVLGITLGELRAVADQVEDDELAEKLRLAIAAGELVELALLEAGDPEGTLSMRAAADSALELLPRVGEIVLGIEPGDSPEKVAELARLEDRLRLAVASLRTSLALLSVGG